MSTTSNCQYMINCLEFTNTKTNWFEGEFPDSTVLRALNDESRIHIVGNKEDIKHMISNFLCNHKLEITLYVADENIICAEWYSLDSTGTEELSEKAKSLFENGEIDAYINVLPIQVRKLVDMTVEEMESFIN